jgi:2-polyprenyl-3-methyl-5-hydroxy-6-metoxy-1,4-benzoquinol methylase
MNQLPYKNANYRVQGNDLKEKITIRTISNDDIDHNLDLSIISTFSDYQKKKLDKLGDLYNKSVDEIIKQLYDLYASRKQENDVSWGLSSGFQKRLSAAEFKLNGITRYIDNTFKRQTDNKYLALGCGDGAMETVFAKRYRMIPTFIDIDDNIEPSLKKAFVFELFDPSKAIEGKIKYDVVSMFHIIHHIPTLEDIKFRIKNMHDLLQPNGLLLCREHDLTDNEQTANMMYAFICLFHISYEINELKSGMSLEDYMLYIKDYKLSLTSINVLASIVCQCGFKLLNVSNVYGADNSYYILFQKI